MKRFQSFLILGACILATANPAVAFEKTEGRSPTTIIGSTLGTCFVTQGVAYLDRDAVVSLHKMEGMTAVLSQNAGGVAFDRGTLDFSNPPITREALGECLEIDPSDIIGLDQNGANGQFHTDDFIGFSFEIASGAMTNDALYVSGQRYRFEIGEQECSRIYCSND